jgi:hypothetical protein
MIYVIIVGKIIENLVKIKNYNIIVIYIITDCMFGSQCYNISYLLVYIMSCKVCLALYIYILSCSDDTIIICCYLHRSVYILSLSDISLITA